MALWASHSCIQKFICNIHLNMQELHFIFPKAQQLLVGQGLRFIEASRSHSDTPHSVGLLWTSDQPVAETSIWQHTILTTDRHPCLRWDSFFLPDFFFSPCPVFFLWSIFVLLNPSVLYVIVFHSTVLIQHNTIIHAPRWDSNPQSQQANGRRPTPYTARSELLTARKMLKFANERMQFRGLMKQYSITEGMCQLAVN
jgi:hypothetical protein